MLSYQQLIEKYRKKKKFSRTTEQMFYKKILSFLLRLHEGECRAFIATSEQHRN